MSDAVGDDGALAPGDASGPSAGTLLRQAREATGLHIAALAVAMKVPVKKLEALESDRLADLPDAVFVRALAASVCRTLKIDAAPVLAKLPLSVAPKLDAHAQGLNAPVPPRPGASGQSLSAWAARPAMLWVIVLLLAALVVVFFPDVHPTVSNTDTAAVAVAMSPTIAEPPAAREAPAASAPQEAASAAAPVAAEAPTAPVAAAAPAVAAAPTAAPAVAAAPVAEPTGVVAFKARESSWVRVTDSKGAVQFEKMLAAGESGAASGALPLAVVVGNVGATEVTVRGQAYALDAFNKNNVARFEVK